MPRKKAEEFEEVDAVKEVEEKMEREEVKDKPRFYKGYDIKWLKNEATDVHPDKYLVKEYEDLYGEV